MVYNSFSRNNPFSSFFSPTCGTDTFSKQPPAAVAATWCWHCQEHSRTPGMRILHLRKEMRANTLLPPICARFIVFIASIPLCQINFTLFSPSKLIKYSSPDSNWKISLNLKPYLRLGWILSFQSIYLKQIDLNLTVLKSGYYLD